MPSPSRCRMGLGRTWADDLGLLTSELVTNAVRHGGSQGGRGPHRTRAVAR